MIKLFKSGACVVVDAPASPRGLWVVTLRNAAGEVHDKAKCDSKRTAGEYRRAFERIAKTWENAR